MKFAHLGLKSKFMSGSVFPIILITFLAIAGIWSLRILMDAIQLMERTNNLRRHTVGVDLSLLGAENSLREYLLTGEESSWERCKSAMTTVSKNLVNMKKLVAGRPKEVKGLDEASLAWESWTKMVADAQVEHSKGTIDLKAVSKLHADLLGSEAKKKLEDVKTIVRTLDERIVESTDDQVQTSIRTASIVEDLVIYGVATFIILTLAINYYLAGKVTGPLQRAVTFAESVSKGDLSERLDFNGTDEVARLGMALDTMVDIQRQQTRQISEMINALSTTASEISSTVSHLSASSQETSASVTETSTTMEQVKHSAGMAKEKAEEVAQAAQEAVKVSQEGAEATQDTVTKMNLIKDQMESIGETVVRLSDQSQAIEDIMATVQDLADQSNLLAVNASIEASRAGDHGKGFTVVANEIKSLADQSKEATEQVRSILNDTRKWVGAVVMATEQGGKAVEAGVEQSVIAGEAISTLASSVEVSAQAASVIQATSEQQAAGMGQVSTAMMSIEEAVRGNLTGVEQLASTSRTLADMGNDLKAIVSEYRI